MEQEQPRCQNPNCGLPLTIIPGPHERWEQALRVAYRASSDVEARLTSWQDELEVHHEREGRAEDSL